MMRFLVLAHRWVGIILCLFFAAWFLSGAVLIYHPFPSLSEDERLSHSADVNYSKISVSPREAISATNITEQDRLRLIDRDGRPIYVLHSFNNTVFTIGADDGIKLSPITNESAGRIAERFLSKPMSRVDGPIEYDQWIVHQRFDTYRPFYRVHFKDTDKTVLYVSEHTGEVLQKTLRAERIWNYFGAVVHWVYPTVLRKNWALWDQTVWWISLLGVVTTVAGLWLGISRLRVLKQTNRLIISSPFNGWLRAHHILGIFIGVFVFTWILSGWLSMDHGRIFSQPDPLPKQVKDYRGISITQASESVSTDAFKTIKDFKEAEIIAVGGKIFVLSKTKNGLELYEPSNNQSLSPTKLTQTQVTIAVEHAWPKAHVISVQQLENNDIYGKLRSGTLPDATLRIILDDPAQTWVHINMENGEILSVMDRSRRIYRWLFNGLHNLDFPGLTNHRPLWDIIILTLLTLGFVFSVIGVVIGWRRIFN
ncbi:MAG: PepSY domain-containing protein [Betaproteobacteria bacterium]|nr:PepSY domain-containing protein [Betaproteobacteria bacterium]